MDSVNESTQRRLAAGEAAFRAINEAIERGQWPGEGSTQVGFRCECAELGCASLLGLTVGDYERVRTSARRFVVAPGHERLEIETVVERRDGYLVVEKRDQAARVAQDTNPRQ